MLFPTTIAGSLPKPEWLAEPNTLWAPWKSKGDELVRAKRDETVWPSKGCWPEYKGRNGTVVSVNRARTVKHRDGKTVKIEAEYGVSFTKSAAVDAWFRTHELRVTS